MRHPALLAASISVATLLMPVVSDAQLFTWTRDQMVEATAQNPFERFSDGRPKIPDALIERARGLSAEEVWAVLPGQGFRNQYADGFRVLHPEHKLAGRAFTVQFMPLRPDLEGVINTRAKAAGASAYEQPGRDRHAAAGRRAGRRSLRPGRGRHHRRRQPLLLHHEDDEERRAGRRRRDPRSRGHLAHGHARVLPRRPPERDQQRRSSAASTCRCGSARRR